MLHFFPNGSIIDDGQGITPADITAIVTAILECCQGSECNSMSCPSFVSSVGTTYNRETMKQIPLCDRPAIVILQVPEAELGGIRSYRWVIGDTNTPNDVSVVDPGDGSGHWVEITM